MEFAIGAVAVVLGSVLTAVGKDRFPRVIRVVRWLGLVILSAAVVWFASVSLWATVVAAGTLLLANWALAFFATTGNLRVGSDPAGLRFRVWEGEAVLLEGLGWIRVGSWRLDLGQVQPVLTVLRRQDGTRLGMMGTAAAGGTVSIDTLLDDGRGLLVTLRGASESLRPPWMLRQALSGDLEELIRTEKGIF